MSTMSSGKWQAYVDCHLQALKKPTHRGKARERRPAVTISRETGAGGLAIAERLAGYLQARTPKSECPWTVLNRNLVQKVLEQHALPGDLAKFMPEDAVSSITDTIEELLGLHPPAWKMVRQTTETILHLAELGNAIIVGRGATVITSRMEHVFHARLVGSLNNRAVRVQAHYRIGRKEAMAFIEKEDIARRRYVKRHFGRDITDPLLYHLILNTDYFSLDEAAELIGEAVLKYLR